MQNLSSERFVSERQFQETKCKQIAKNTNTAFKAKRENSERERGFAAYLCITKQIFASFWFFMQTIYTQRVNFACDFHHPHLTGICSTQVWKRRDTSVAFTPHLCGVKQGIKRKKKEA